MKKAYNAPGIIFQSLAAGASSACAFQATNAAYACPVELEGFFGETVFVEDYGCDWTPQDGVSNPCYDVPVASSNVFES